MEELEIAQKISNIGGKLYLVGGAVRDELLGKRIHDKDYCVTGLSEQEFSSLFPESSLIGKSFPVFQLFGSDFALARRETKAGIGHKGFEWESDASISIEEDLARRDLTVNAIAKDVLTGEYCDPFHGREDLQNRCLRATTKAFCEDPLRVYRTSRFAASLGFSMESSTLLEMKSIAKELHTLPKERVFDEFRKALSCPTPSLFFRSLHQAGVLEEHFSEIAHLIGSLQPTKYHPEGDSFEHTMLVLDTASAITSNLLLRFCCLVHDLGKGLTPKKEYPHHYGHDKTGVSLVTSLGERIRCSEKMDSCWKSSR